MRVAVETGRAAREHDGRRAAGNSRLAGKKSEDISFGQEYGSYAMAGTLQSGTAEWILQAAKEQREEKAQEAQVVEGEGAVSGQRPQAAVIYEAAVAGKQNPIENMRQPYKVPYEYLAKDGIIEYNGVCFVCDEKTNSICLGDMTDKKNVLNIPLSGGGHLKVNRDSIGLLPKAIGMFSPEDVNRIMRAIAQDTKIQSMKQEMEDMENSVGEKLRAEDAEDADCAESDSREQRAK